MIGRECGRGKAREKKRERERYIYIYISIYRESVRERAAIIERGREHTEEGQHRESKEKTWRKKTEQR